MVRHTTHTEGSDYLMTQPAAAHTAAQAAAQHMQLSTAHYDGPAERMAYRAGYAVRHMHAAISSCQIHCHVLDTAWSACCAAACRSFFDDLCLLNTGTRGAFVMRSLMSARTDSR
eukprot:7378565-Prymnesium_polylepis.2